MSVLCVVQARYGSTRFPGKVLADLDGIPVLAFLLRRLAPLGVDHLVVATTEAPADDAVAAVAHAEGADVVRGPTDDVLGRFVLALERHPADIVVRLTADCPLADPALIALALDHFNSDGADYVSNTLVRTFPDGLDVEVVAADVLRTADAESRDPVEREHVTPFVYRRPERFRLGAFRHRTNGSAYRWTVDTPDDLDRVRRLVSTASPSAGWEELLAGAGPPPRTDTLTLEAAAADDADFVRDLRNDPDAVRWSGTRAPVAAAEHATWFAARLDDPGSRIWLARERRRPVGQVRVDVTGGVGRVSLGVTAAERGRGLGSRILHGLDRALAADEQVHTLVAAVDPENIASRRLFAAAGFTPDGTEGRMLLLRRRRRRDPAPREAPTGSG